MIRKQWPGKARLDASMTEMMVLGGAVLGGGGGGKLEPGLRLGQLVLELGHAALVDLDDLPSDANLIAIATFRLPVNRAAPPRPRHYSRAIELLSANTTAEIAGLANCGSGALDTLVGWGQAALLEIPLADVAFAQDIHPAAAIDLIERCSDNDPPLFMTLVSDDRQDDHRLEIFAQGTPRQLCHLLRQSAVQGEGGALAIGPLSQRWVREKGELSLLSRTVDVGQAMIQVADDGGGAMANAVSRVLDGRVIACGMVTDIVWHGNGGCRAYGNIYLRDIHNQPLEIVFWHRYLALDMAGQRIATFPDLIAILGAKGTPLNGEEVSKGQDVYILVAPGKPPMPKMMARRKAIYGDIESITGKPMLPFLTLDELPDTN